MYNDPFKIKCKHFLTGYLKKSQLVIITILIVIFLIVSQPGAIMLIPIVNSNEQKIKLFIKQIKISNMDKQVQEELIDMLHSVIQQIKQFQEYGWV